MENPYIFDYSKVVGNIAFLLVLGQTLFIAIQIISSKQFRSWIKMSFVFKAFFVLAFFMITSITSVFFYPSTHQLTAILFAGFGFTLVGFSQIVTWRLLIKK